MPRARNITLASKSQRSTQPIADERHRLNEGIEVDKVRLIGASGSQIGVVVLAEALQEAEREGLDLVEIVPNSDPPVCRVMDYGKYLFQQNKKRQGARRKRKQFQIKEIKFRPNIGKGDYDIKMRSLLRFLEQGDKVKITVRFRGREMTHAELGTQVLERIVQDIEQQGSVEQEAKLAGKLMTMVVAPLSTNR